MQSFGKSSLWLLLARLTSQGLAILFVAMVARRLGVESFGQFTFIGALVLIGNTFTNFGTDTYIIRELSRAGRTTSLIPAAFGLQMVLSTIWWLAILIFRPDAPLVIYSLALFPLAVVSVVTATLRAFERMDRVWALSLTNGAVQILAALLAVDLWTLCVFLLLGQILVAAISYWIGSASLDDFSLKPIYDIRPLLGAALPFAALTVLIVLAQRLGVLSVSALLGDSATGLFSAVARIVDGLKLGHYAVLGALLPILSRGGRESRQGFRSGFGLLMVLSLLLAVALSLFPEFIILFLYGEDFSPAAGLLAVLGWCLIPYTVSTFISYDLIARGREITLLKATVVSLAGFLVLYLSLISLFNLNGAVYAALAGEALQAVIYLLFLYRSGVSLQPLIVERSLE